MTKIEIYNKAFVDLFHVKEDALQVLKYQDIPEWDSVGHMTLMAALEDEFNIMFDTEDILEFNSYKQGIEILKKYNIDCSK